MPQLLVSVCRSTHAPGTPGDAPQTVSPVPHWQLLSAQPPPVGQRTPQAPQLRSSLVKLVSQPFMRLVSQSPRPVLQVQRPDVQPPAEFGRPTHVAPHAPQCAGVACRS